MKRVKLVIMPRLNDANGRIDEPWFIFYSYRNPQTGKMQRFKISKGFKALSKQKRYAYAEELIAEYTKKLKGGWNPFITDNIIYEDNLQYENVRRVYGKLRKTNLTVDYFLSDFLDYSKRQVCKKSFESYQSRIRLFSHWLHTKGLSNNDISGITSDIILDFINYLIEDRGLQGRTIQKYGVNLRQFFKYLLDKKKIYVNPMPDMPKIPNKVDKAAKPIRQGDVGKLKNLIIKEDPQLWLACQIQFYCFLRPGNELRNMRIRWIDFDASTITIPSYEETDTGYEGRAKNRKERTVLIPQQLLAEMQDKYMLQNYHDELFVFSHNHVPGTKPLGKNNMRNRFNRFRDAIGLSKDYKFYSWKHTGGISASNAGIPVKDIQLQMGHHSLDITDKYLRKMKGVESEHLKNNFPTL